ncbi:MAG TPA: 2-oxoacid:ferredoxin oxidoreductase subunit beta [bacterium]|nr:2-oxoacid:ferredoxin oxidoreductase subunit beta [bacterium]
MSSFSKRNVIEGLQYARELNAQQWRDNLPTWCPGCGHFTALNGLYEAANKLKIDSKNFVVVSGIGCSGRFPFFINGFGLHTLHGRSIPVATGVKIANPELTVVVVGGDGDGVGIGGGHFPHAARNNFNLSYILLDNNIYGLTKGQISPTSPLGMVSATSPYGNVARPLDPTSLAIVYGATFVARVFSKQRDLVSDVILQAIEHRGFSFVHDLSPCVEFNKLVTYKSWNDRVQPLPDEYEATDKITALQYAQTTDPIYLGVFYREDSPTFDDYMAHTRKQALKK